ASVLMMPVRCAASRFSSSPAKNFLHGSRRSLIALAASCTGQLDATQDHCQLRRVERDRHALSAGSGDFKAPLLQAFIKQAITIAIEPQELQPVVPLVDEDEQATSEHAAR